MSLEIVHEKRKIAEKSKKDTGNVREPPGRRALLSKSVEFSLV